MAEIIFSAGVISVFLVFTDCLLLTVAFTRADLQVSLLCCHACCAACVSFYSNAVWLFSVSHWWTPLITVIDQLQTHTVAQTHTIAHSLLSHTDMKRKKSLLYQGFSVAEVDTISLGYSDKQIRFSYHLLQWTHGCLANGSWAAPSSCSCMELLRIQPVIQVHCVVSILMYSLSHVLYCWGQDR